MATAIHALSVAGASITRWLNLLFLPLLVPTVLVPMLNPRTMGEVVYLDPDGRPIEVVVVDEDAASDIPASAADLPEAAPSATAVASSPAADEPPVG